MKILKFGGSSVATPERVRHVASLVARSASEGPIVVVVSAFGGVTNDLLDAAETAARHDDAYQAPWTALRDRHRAAVEALAPADERSALGGEIEARFSDLHDLLRGVYLLRECSPRSRDSIVSYGERLSAVLVAAALRGQGTGSSAVDARSLIVTDDTFGRAQVDMAASTPKIRTALEAVHGRGEIPVVTGFVAATPAGHTTTLGRGGSDYTAALLGAAVGADAIELWTDVDGVLSADPRRVDGAFPLRRMRYAELMELSHFGAKVVYPPTVHPARAAGIPLVIKNTFAPDAPGTTVSDDESAGEHAVRGVTSIPRVALMRLEGDGMVGVPGVASRLFGALAARGVSVILISQASSEHSICFAVAPDDAAGARTAVDEAFALERQAGLVDPLVVEDGLSVVAVVGEGLRHRTGVAGQLFGVLGRAGVNIHAIAQGSSERNISLVVEADDEARAIRSVHSAFFDHARVVRVAVAGVGRVGAALLDQIASARESLRERGGIDLRVTAIARRDRALVTSAGVPLEDWRGALDAASEGGAGLRETVVDGGASVLIDVTASNAVSAQYESLLRRGVAVVAANKRAFSDTSARWEALVAASREGAALRFETTVGAGLPVVGPLADLVASGDRVLAIDGVLSGTVNAVLDRVDRGARLSDAVRDAHAEGLTEPHPYEDLGGADVGRKLCILARLAGHVFEPEAVVVEPLLPGHGWADKDLEAFWRDLPSCDEHFAALRAAAAADGKRLRYVARVDGSGARVALEAVDPEHPAFAVVGADNVVAVTSERYRDSPWVVRGPGAGPEVTAAGVFADLLAVARMQAS